MDMAAQIQECDRLVKLGQIPAATRLFRTLPSRKLPEPLRLPLARLARRLGLLSAGFRLLRSGKVSLAARRDPAWQAELGILLIQNGNVAEAGRLLGRLDPTHADVLMARGWCEIERWDHAAAVAPLEEHLRQRKDPYWSLAGRVNLGEAYAFSGNLEAALKQLGAALRESEKMPYHRLRANAFHVRAQARFLAGDLARSDADLERAMALFGHHDASDAILIRRQAAINEAHRRGDPGPLRRFRQEAQRAGAWESVREADFELLRLRFDPLLLARLYYGTPYAAYRARLERTFGRGRIPARYLWGSRRGLRWRLDDRASITGSITRQNHHLFEVLLLDFYRPLGAGELFASLFPGERFDHARSPVRVHQALKRLRGWLVSERLPLAVKCQGRRYRLERMGEVGIEITRGGGAVESPVEALRRTMGPRWFSAADARSALAVSRASATRYLGQGVACRELETSGRGRATRYRLL